MFSNAVALKEWLRNARAHWLNIQGDSELFSRCYPNPEWPSKRRKCGCFTASLELEKPGGVTNIFLNSSRCVLHREMAGLMDGIAPRMSHSSTITPETSTTDIPDRNSSECVTDIPVIFPLKEVSRGGILPLSSSPPTTHQMPGSPTIQRPTKLSSDAVPGSCGCKDPVS